MADEIEVKGGLVETTQPAEEQAVSGPLNSFMVILQDDPANPGHVNVGGTQTPPEFQPRSAAHVVGRFIQNNLSDIILAAQYDWLAKNRKPDAQVITGDRERTILLPGA